MPASLVAIGNPGSGKSTILNAVAGMNLFQSGISIGDGLTFQLERKTDASSSVYIDTPGMSDNKHRKKAGQDISALLKTGGSYKILIFVKQTHGRVVTEDITTMKLILDAAPEIGNRFGIIVNQVSSEVMEQLQNDENISKFLLSLFHGINNTFRHNNIIFLPAKPSLDGKKNQLISLGEFPDLIPFLNSLPEVDLTPNLANDIATESFDEMTSMIAELRNKMEDDKKTYQKEVDALKDQVEKLKRENGGGGLFGLIAPFLPPIITVIDNLLN